MSSVQRSTGVGPTEPPYSTGVGSTEPPYSTGVGSTEPPYSTGVGSTEPPYNTGVGSTEPAYNTGVGSTEPAYNADEMMAVEASRRLTSKNVCFVGIGLPSLAANLARRTHAPGCVLVYESGTIGAKPTRLPLSIGDGELAETADSVVSVPEMFAYWLQSGRIDVGFLGAAQIDRHGNLNSTVIGRYDTPKVRLPGGGGAPEIATSVENVFVMLRQTPRAFVERLDFKTSRGDRVRVVVTDLGVLEPRNGELTLVRVHPGVTVDDARAATGWELAVAPDLDESAPPTGGELAALRALEAAE